MENPTDLAELYLFAQVVDAGGFSAAARHLNMSKATISRRIARLEQRLGATLIQRSTHQFHITEIGQMYYQHCAAIVLEAEAAQQTIDLHRHAPCGTIKLSCPKELLDMYVNAMLVRFMAAYPDISLHVESTNRRVDVVQERFDMAIRVCPWPLPDSTLIAKPLLKAELLLVASPKLVVEPLPGPEALQHFPSLSHMDNDHFWPLQHPQMGEQRIAYHPKLISENIQLLRDAAVNGIGIVALPAFAVASHLASGCLNAVLPAWKIPGGMVHAVYASRRGMLPSVSALLNFLSAEFSACE